MADGEVTLKLGVEAARLLQAAADAAGRPVDPYAAELLSERLLLDADWAEDLRILEECERTGITYSVEKGMAVFDAALKTHLGKGG